MREREIGHTEFARNFGLAFPREGSQVLYQILESHQIKITLEDQVFKPNMSNIGKRTNKQEKCRIVMTIDDATADETVG